MKTKPNRAVRELRKTLRLTQSGLAAMIGASRDTVVSWELGRNNLSPQFAGRLAFATGVEVATLLRGRGPVTTHDPLLGSQPFTAESFARHRSTNWGRSDEVAARHHLQNCADALRILFVAAARPAGGQDRHQLPAVLESFRQLCEETRASFQLDEQIYEQLAQRQFTIGQTHTYGQWRSLHQQSPDALKAAGFKDNPRKKDDEELFVGREAFPDWTPGACMKGPLPGRTILLPRQ